LPKNRDRRVVDVGVAANVATALAVIVALVFGIIQVRQNQRKARQEAAVEIIRTAFTPEFGHGTSAVFALPDAIGLDDLQARGLEDWQAALTIIHAYELIGWMVYWRLLPLQAVDEIMGGYIRRSWTKLGKAVAEERARSGSPNTGEWFQWLAEQLEKHPVRWKKEGAHVALRNWKP
jgi:hypothetical protein